MDGRGGRADAVRIAWFTPFSRSNPVAAFSAAVAEHLAGRGMDVAIWYSHETLDPYPTPLPSVAFSPDLLPRGELTEDVLPVYNLGATPGAYGAVLAVARRLPGVVILHDATVSQAWSDAAGRPRYASFGEALRRWYGEAEAAHGVFLAQTTPGGVLPAYFAIDHSLMAATVQGARAVVVHSRHQLDMLQGAWGGYWAELPYAAAPLPEPGRVPPPSEGRVRILAAIREHEVPVVRAAVAALAAAGLGDRAELWFSGPLDGASLEGRRLRWLVEDAGLQHAVRWHGEVTGDELAALMRSADIHVYPRIPETEGMSPSLLHALSTGRPVVGADHGSIREVPSDAVAHVDWDDAEVTGRVLAGLVDDAARRDRIGAAGRAWAAARTFPRYADGLHDVLRYVESHPLVPALADDVGDHLQWLGVEDGMHALLVVAHELERLALPPALTPPGSA